MLAGTRRLLGTKHRTVGEPEAIVVNKKRRRNAKGWYCARCPAPEPPKPMYMFLYARSPNVKIEIVPWIPTTWRAEPCKASFRKTEAMFLIPSPPTTSTIRRLEHKSGTLGLLVTTVSGVRMLPPKRDMVGEGPPRPRRCNAIEGRETSERSDLWMLESPFRLKTRNTEK